MFAQLMGNEPAQHRHHAARSGPHLLIHIAFKSVCTYLDRSRRHKAYRSGCLVAVQQSAGLSCLPSWRATTLHGNDICCKVSSPVSSLAWHQVVVHKSELQEETKAYRSGCSYTAQCTAGLSCLPSWRATTLHGTDIMLQGLFPSLLARMASKWLCTNLSCRRRQRLIGQIVLIHFQCTTFRMLCTYLGCKR